MNKATKTIRNWTRQRYLSSRTGRHHCRIVSYQDEISTSAIHRVDGAESGEPVVITVTGSVYRLVEPMYPELPNSDLNPENGDWHLAPMRA